MLIYIPWFLGAYLVGSLSMAIILCKVARLPDPRTQYSGNPGATNVFRYAGKGISAAVLLGDALKGLIPALLVKLYIGVPWVVTATMLCAFLGHLYPIFFQFKGGKGVATYLGGLLGGFWFLGTLAAGTWLVVAAITRYSSLSALIMALVIPVAGYFAFGGLAAIPLAIMTVLLWWRHRNNIQKLLSGRESKIGQGQ